MGGQRQESEAQRESKAVRERDRDKQRQTERGSARKRDSVCVFVCERETHKEIAGRRERKRLGDRGERETVR